MSEKGLWKIKPSAKSIRTSSTISSWTRDESTEPAILRRASEWRRVPDPWHFDWQLLTTTQLAPASSACRAQRGLSSLGELCNQLGLTEINNAPDQRHVSHSSITRSSRVHWLHCFRNCRMDSNRGADFIVLSAGKGWDGKTDSWNPQTGGLECTERCIHRIYVKQHVNSNYLSKSPFRSSELILHIQTKLEKLILHTQKKRSAERNRAMIDARPLRKVSFNIFNNVSTSILSKWRTGKPQELLARPWACD